MTVSHKHWEFTRGSLEGGRVDTESKNNYFCPVSEFSTKKIPNHVFVEVCCNLNKYPRMILNNAMMDNPMEGVSE